MPTVKEKQVENASTALQPKDLSGIPGATDKSTTATLSTLIGEAAELAMVLANGLSSTWYSGTYTAPRRDMAVVYDEDWDAQVHVTIGTGGTNFGGLAIYEDGDQSKVIQVGAIYHSGGYKFQELNGPSWSNSIGGSGAAASWVRIRQRGGTVYVDYAAGAAGSPPDQEDWTTPASHSTPYNRSNAVISVFAKHDGTGENTVEFRNFTLRNR